jgi:hypothetical protein
MGRSRTDLPRDFPDRAVRDALLHGANVRALLRSVMPDIAERLDYARMEVVKLTYLLDDWRKRDNDVLLRLPFRDAPGGREVLVCILIEHQSTADQAMPLRMLVYAVLYWEGQWKAWQEAHRRGEPLRLTPVLPVVLHTAQQRWDQGRSLADLFDVPEALKSWGPQWAMPLWDLPEHPTEELLHSSEAFWQALAVARSERAPTDEYLGVLRESLQRLQPLGTQQQVYWHELLRLVLYWSIYRRPDREHDAIIRAARESQADVQIQQEVQTMSTEIAKTWEEELNERIAKAAERAALQREVQVYRTTLRTQLEQRFPGLPEEVVRRLEAADLERLKRAVAQVLTIRSPEELRL